MKTVMRGLSLAIFLIIFTAIFGYTNPVSGRDGHLTVLMYHRFDAGGAISTPMSDFKRQISYLQKHDYNFLSLDTVRNHLRKQKKFPPKSILITIDDGYESTYTKAFPFLEKHDIPWVLYVYTESIQKNYPSALSWKQIKTIAESGVPVENHTYSHSHIPTQKNRSEKWYNHEIHTPHTVISDETEQSITSFAIPYGEYDRALIKKLKKTYSIVWGIDPGVVDPTNQSAILPRFGINRSTSFSEFKKKLHRLPLRIKSSSLKPGTRLKSVPDTVSVRLDNTNSLKRGVINVFLSESGAVDWKWGNNSNEIVINLPENLDQFWNRIIITAYDSEDGKYRYYSHGFIYENANQ